MGRLRLSITAALLLVPGVFYVWTPVRWQREGLTPVRGDEPHYLITAAAIARDHHLRVNRAYGRDAVEKRIYGPVDWQNHSQSGPHGAFSIHGIGISLLVAPLFALWGIVGARLTLGLLAACVPFLLWRVARLRGLGWHESLGLACCASCGLPFLLASGQIYPDLVTGVVLLALAVIAIRASVRGATHGFAALAGLLLAVLPWLHVKNVAPAACVVAMFLFLGVQRRRSWPRLTRPAATLGPLALSLLLLAWYNVYAFGSVAGPYASGQPGAGATLRQAAVIFLGLHFDQSQGLFVQQPLFLLGLPGVVVLARRERVLIAGLLCTYLAVVVPNAFHECWYGCASLPGRFMWAVAALWFVPLISFYAGLHKRERIAACAFAAGTVVWQAALMVRWYGHPASLYMPWPQVLPDRNSLVGPAWRGVFPSFYDFNNSLAYAQNIVAVTAALVLIGVGAVVALRREQVEAPSHTREVRQS